MALHAGLCASSKTCPGSGQKEATSGQIESDFELSLAVEHMCKQKLLSVLFQSLATKGQREEDSLHIYSIRINLFIFLLAVSSLREEKI